MQLLELLVLGSQTALGGDIDDEEHFSLERRKGRLGAVNGGHGDVFESSHGLINTD